MAAIYQVEMLGQDPIGVLATRDTDALVVIEPGCVFYAASDWYDPA